MVGLIQMDDMDGKTDGWYGWLDIEERILHIHTDNSSLTSCGGALSATAA